jgi:hypothetical protein
MGGIGGQSITEDACDKCWGSGLESHKGTDLRAVFRAQDTIIRAWRKHTAEAVMREHRAERLLCALVTVLDAERVDIRGHDHRWDKDGTSGRIECAECRAWRQAREYVRAVTAGRETGKDGAQ